MEHNLIDNNDHVVSELMKQITEDFISHFKKNYFTKIHNIEQMGEKIDDTKNNHLEKVSSPALSINPSFKYVSDDKSPFFNSFRNLKFLNSETNIIKIYNTSDYAVVIAHFDQMEFSIEYKIKLSTKAQQMRLHKFLLLNMRCNDMYNTPLQTEILLDDVVIDRLSNILKIGTDDSNFLSTLNKISIFPITYKYNTTLGKDKYTILFPVVALFNYNEPVSTNDVKENIKKNFITTITLNCSARVPTSFLYRDNMDYDDKLDNPIERVFSETFKLSDDSYLNKDLYRNEFDSEYEAEFNEEGIDTLNVRELMEFKFKDYVSTLSESDFDACFAVEYKLAVDGDIDLIYGEDYSMHNGIVILNNLKHIEGSHYRISVYMDRSKYNNYLEANRYKESL